MERITWVSGQCLQLQRKLACSSLQNTIENLSSKTNTKNVIGTAGTKEILRAISEDGGNVRAVSIGGINASTVQRVLYQSSDSKKKLDGVAVVSAIVAAKDPKKAAEDLMKLIKSPPPFASCSLANAGEEADFGNLAKLVPAIIKAVAEQNPLSHNMTNLVVQNFAANVALSVGGSPIMSNYGEEAADLCKMGGSLVINMGTVTPEGLQNYVKSLKAYNVEGSPVVFDPVGAGATAVRRSAVKTLLAAGYFDVIKGNEGEIRTVFGSAFQQKGVDSGTSTLNNKQKAALVKDLAARERNVVVMTGATDFLSDGKRTFAVSNGHELLGKITGSGCVLGTIISLTLAVSRGDKLLAALAGLLHFEIAAEIAATREDVKGPGSFVPALIDELYNIHKAASRDDLMWLQRARLEAVDQ
jgi:thiamine-phosphate diphosphorylase / hydroxyethylthiazole kinase